MATQIGPRDYITTGPTTADRIHRALIAAGFTLDHSTAGRDYRYTTPAGQTWTASVFPHLDPPAVLLEHPDYYHTYPITPDEIGDFTRWADAGCPLFGVKED